MLYFAVCTPSAEKNIKLRSKALIEKLSLYFARNGELNTMRRCDGIKEDALRDDFSVAHGVNAFQDKFVSLYCVNGGDLLWLRIV